MSVLSDLCAVLGARVFLLPSRFIQLAATHATRRRRIAISGPHHTSSSGWGCERAKLGSGCRFSAVDGASVLGLAQACCTGAPTRLLPGICDVDF